MIYTDEIQIPLKDGINRPIRTEVTENSGVLTKQSSFDTIFGNYFPSFIIGCLNAMNLKKNTIDL